MSLELTEAIDPTAVSVELKPAVNLLVAAIVTKNGVPAAVASAEATIDEMRPFIQTTWPVACNDEVYRLIAHEALSQVTVTVDPPKFLASSHEPWFGEAVISGDISLDRWYSYKAYLTYENGFPPQVVDSLDSSSNDIVDLLGNPNLPGVWKRRGLVIGDVQSGKTATYIGIINKAADAGFRLVVLLTGGTENLRKQTQNRVDHGFLGKDSTLVKDRTIGVGNFPTSTNFLRGQGMTTHAKDFVGATLAGQAVHIDPNADHPYVFVIKKNKTPLSNLIKWLKGQFKDEQFDIPMLVVDDESDYASVNTNYRTDGDTNPTIINQKIRELLALTTRSSYMAFTATPFANVFIDHNSFSEALQDDLFPHHYIFALSSPSNYQGAREYFGSSSKATSEALVDIFDANESFPEKHRSSLSVDSLPHSLEEALYAFVVASAIRVLRDDHGPRSMLINVSRFKNVQQQVFELVGGEFSRIKTAIEIHAHPPVTGPDKHPVLLRLEEVFSTYFAGVDVSWQEVRDKLFACVYDTKVELVNSSRDKSGGELAQNVIAVGGDVLSRGLTVSGLTVSYFYRIVGAADTLLQMGRWFGYRPGYADLVRIWISPDVADRFRYVAEVSDELREQVREMRELDKRPEDFGLMVRKHPESLAITAKRGVAETHRMVISLSGRRIETTRIPADPRILTSNFDAVYNFLLAIESDDLGGGWTQPGLAFEGKIAVPKGRIADLLENFRYDRGNLILANALHKIIRQQSSETFDNWTVGVVGGEGDPTALTTTLHMRGTPRRSVRLSEGPSLGTFRISGASSRLAGSGDLGRTFASGGTPLLEPAVYESLPRPTLLIYPLQPDFGVRPSGSGRHAQELATAESTAAQQVWTKATDAGVQRIMALKIGIPGASGSTRGDVEYMLNGPAIEEFAQDFGLSSEDEEQLDD